VVPSEATATPAVAPAESGRAPADEPHSLELSTTARPAPREASKKQGPPPAAAPAARPEERAPVAAASGPEADQAAARNEIAGEGAFAREPVASPAVGGAAREAEASREKAGPDRLRTADARAATQSMPPALSAAAASARVEVPPAEERTDAFRRLESERPRTAAEWRRLRDQWKAVAAREADPVRADEARVQAVEAARQAWRAGGDEGDAAAFRREAEAYLLRDDARQKPRVEALLAER
jgi:hypothetical protein